MSGSPVNHIDLLVRGALVANRAESIYRGYANFYGSILEFRNDKVSRQTEYFAAPFPAAEWRSQWVEKIEPHK